MATASGQRVTGEGFTSGGRAYVWDENDARVRGQRVLGPRASLPGVFVRAVVPGLERRGASCTIQPVRHGAVGVGASRPYWVTWRAPGDVRDVWALYVPTRRGGIDASHRGRPANDGALLVAWGDGPVLAWASERSDLRAVARAALRALPWFLSEGVASADGTWPLRIEAVTPGDAARGGPRGRSRAS